MASSAMFLSSCSENKTVDSKEIAQEENMDNLSDDEKEVVVLENDGPTVFLMKVAEMQLEEISLGKLAQQKGTTTHVKELGKMMEQDHTKSLSEVQALAQAKTVAIPTVATKDSNDAYEKLNGKTGNDFDKDYSDMMVKHHEDAIDLFEKASTDSEDAEIRAWAGQKLPGLKTHLDHAKACKEASDKLD
jgi:putative membrane protein